MPNDAAKFAVSMFVVVAAAFVAGCASAPPTPVARTAQTSVPEQTVVAIPGPNGVVLRAHLKIPTAQPSAPNELVAAQKMPAIIFQHGCGGVGNAGKPSMRHQAGMDFAVARGFIALHVDSLTPRGEREICTQKFADRRVTAQDRVADAYAALQFLAQDPRVDPQRIVLWGWSHGGSSVLTALRAPAPRGTSHRFALGISFYPGCTPSAQRSDGYVPLAPLHIFIGEADDWTPAAPCKTFAETMQRLGRPVSLNLYPQAFHGFDDPNPSARVRLRMDVPNGVNPGKGVTAGPNPAAREAAYQEIDRVLRQFR